MVAHEHFQSLSVGGGYNSITTGKDQVYYEGGKTDWLGLDDGSRAMPGAIPAQEDFPINIHEQAVLAKKTTVDWKLYDKKFAPNFNLQYSMGQTFFLKKKSSDTTKKVEGKPLGVILAITYNKANNYNETTRQGYTGNNAGSTTPAQNIL